MATVDELLAAEVTENDDELSFLIDEHLRIITVPERGVVLGVEGDKDVNRVRFRMNRYYHGSDLSSFQIRINYQNAEGEVNYFTVQEKTVGTDTFSFIWVVAADAVMTKGTVFFVVNCFTADSTGVVQKAYHTTLGTASVLEGLEVDVEGNQPQIVDFLAQLKNELTVHAGTVLQQMDEYAKAAESSKTAASSYADAAKTSATSAAGSASAAAESASNAAASAFSASSSATAAGKSAIAAKTSETNAGSSASAASNSATAAHSSATAAKTSETNAGSSASSASSSAAAAGNSASAASSSATAAATSATAAKTSETNAAASETNAKTSEANAKKYADEVRTVAEGYKGWFETEAALTAAVPNGTKGDWAIIGSTNSIWLWDGSGNVWVESVPRIDLSNYPTHAELTEVLKNYLPNRAATATELGGIKVGRGLTMTEDGTLNADAQEYSLPAATLDTLGGIKIGSGTEDLTAGVSELEDGAIYLVYE